MPSLIDEKQFMSRPPTLAELVDGQSVINTSAGNGKITEYIKANSTIYSSDYTTNATTAISGTTINGFDETADGVESNGGGVELDGMGDVINFYDDGGDKRVSIGNIGSSEYGLKLYSSDGNNVLSKFDGDNAHIGGWFINENYIQGDGVDGYQSSNYVKLDSQNKRLEIKDDTQIRAQLGRIGSTLDYGIVLNDSDGNPVFKVHGTTTEISGWTITPEALTGGGGSTYIALTPETGIHMGSASFASAPFNVTKAGVLTATSGTVGGWDMQSNLLRSATDGGARIELNKAYNRMSIFDDINEKAVVGYLEGLLKNNSIGLAITAVGAQSDFTQGSCTYTSGSPYVGHPANSSIVGGLTVTGPDIPADTTITEITNVNSFRMSANPTGAHTGGETLTFSFGTAANFARVTIGTFVDTSCNTNHTAGLSDGTTTSVRHITHTANSAIKIGQPVSGAGVPEDATVVLLNTSTCFTISADTDETNSSQSFTFKSIHAETDDALPYDEDTGIGRLSSLDYWVADSAGVKIEGGTQSAAFRIMNNTYNTIDVLGTGAYSIINTAFGGGSGADKYFRIEFVSDDYGFWALDGDKMYIDGDMLYDSGDWLINSDGAIKFIDGNGLEFMRLGTHNGAKGLFIGAGITDATIAAKYTKTGFKIGDVDGSGGVSNNNYIEYDSSGTLTIAGTLKLTDGTTVATGLNAKTVVVGSTSLVFVKSLAGALSPASVTLTANTQNTTVNGAWSSSLGGTTGLSSIVNTHDAPPTCVVTSGAFVDGMVVTYTLHGSDGSSADAVTLRQLDEGSGNVQAVLSNSAHVFPASVSGAIAAEDYAGSGTTIKVYEGATALDFTSSTPAAGEFAVAIGNTADIVEGEASGNGTTTCTISAHSAAENDVDSYIITYTITGKTQNGTNFTSFTQDQSLSKSKTGAAGTGTAAEAYSITATSDTIVYDPSALSSGVVTPTWTPSTVTFSFTKQIGDGTPASHSIAYRINGGGWQSAATGTGALTSSAYNSTGYINIQIATAGTVGTIVDSETTPILDSSSDLWKVDMSNANVSVTETSAGVYNITLAKTQVKLYQGSTQVTTANLLTAGSLTGTFEQSPNGSSSWTNLLDTNTIDSGDYIRLKSYATLPASITLSHSSGVSDTFTVNASDLGATSAGVDAKVVVMTSADYVIAYDTNGANPSPASTITLTATTQGITDPYFKFTGDHISADGSYIDGVSTKAFTVPATLAAMTNPATIRVGVADGNQSEVAFDMLSIVGVKEGDVGDDSHILILSNPAHVVATESDGVTGINYEQAAGKAIVYDGANDLTGEGGNGGTMVYSLTGDGDIVDNGSTWTNTRDGLIFTLTVATGIYALSGAWTDASDLLTFEVTMVHGGVTLSAIYTIAKSIGLSDYPTTCELTATGLKLKNLEGRTLADFGNLINGGGEPSLYPSVTLGAYTLESNPPGREPPSSRIFLGEISEDEIGLQLTYYDEESILSTEGIFLSSGLIRLGDPLGTHSELTDGSLHFQKDFGNSISRFPYMFSQYIPESMVDFQGEGDEDITELPQQMPTSDYEVLYIPKVLQTYSQSAGSSEDQFLGFYTDNKTTTGFVPRLILFDTDTSLADDLLIEQGDIIYPYSWTGLASNLDYGYNWDGSGETYSRILVHDYRTPIGGVEVDQVVISGYFDVADMSGATPGEMQVGVHAMAGRKGSGLYFQSDGETHGATVYKNVSMVNSQGTLYNSNHTSVFEGNGVPFELTVQWDVDTGTYTGDIGVAVGVSSQQATQGSQYVPTATTTGYVFYLTSIHYSRRPHYTYLEGIGQCSALVVYYG